MAITIDSLVQDGNIDVIIRSDDALDVTDEEYEDYAQTLDEGKLKFRDGCEPTRFVMKRKMSFKHRQMVEGSKLKIEKGGLSVQLGFMVEEVRATLVGIKSPESVPEDKRIEKLFKRNGDGLVSEDFILALGPLVSEIYGVRTAYLSAINEKGADVKKS